MRQKLLPLVLGCTLLLAGCTAPPEPTPTPSPTPSVCVEAPRPVPAVQIALIRDYMGADCRGTDGGLLADGWGALRIQKLDLTCDGETVTGTVEGVRGDREYASYFRANLRGVVGMNDGEPYVESLTYERQDGGISVFLNRVEEAATNEHRQVLAHQWYDLPIVAGRDQNVVEKINTFFEQDCEIFMDDDDFWEVMQWRVAQDEREQPYIRQPLHDTMKTELTYLDTEILSIRQTSHWNAGGMNSTNHYGNTFDFHTGERLTLDYFVKTDAAVFNEWVTDRVLKSYSAVWSEEDIRELFRDLSVSDYRYAYNGESVDIFLDEPRVTGSAPVLRYML